MAPAFVFSPCYTVEIGDHVFPTRKFALVAERLKESGTLVEPEPPSREDLLLVHTPEWIDKVVTNCMTLDDQIRMELPFSPEISAAHQLSVSGTILACRHALERGVGLHVGGGSHHAFADLGEGFCVLNDIAVGIRKMQKEGRVVRAAVIDLDVHQGNGTAALFSGDPSVFTFSMHQAGIYPEKRQRSSLDVDLPIGTGDEAYLTRLQESLPKVFEARPQLVVYQAGVDCAAGDLLGGLDLSPEGLRRRDELVKQACAAAGAPVAVTLGGGYAADLLRTAALHEATLRVFSSL